MTAALSGVGHVREPRARCSALLATRLAVPYALPRTRWALTPPFHPCRGDSPGGLLSVALSVAPRVSPPGARSL